MVLAFLPTLWNGSLSVSIAWTKVAPANKAGLALAFRLLSTSSRHTAERFGRRANQAKGLPFILPCRRTPCPFRSSCFRELPTRVRNQIVTSLPCGRDSPATFWSCSTGALASGRAAEIANQFSCFTTAFFFVRFHAACVTTSHYVFTTKITRQRR